MSYAWRTPLTPDSRLPFLFDLEHCEKCFLRYLHRSHLLHPFLSLALLLEQLALARDVAAVALGGDVLAQRPDRFARDHLRADRRLDHDLEQLPRNQVLQLLGDLAAPLVRLITMDDNAECVHRLTIEHHVELHQFARTVCKEFVIERRLASRDRPQLVVEVENDLGQWEFPIELHARRVEILHPAIHAEPVLTQL